MSADPRGRLGRIEWRLPLTVAGLLIAVVAVFSWMSYREVRAGALRSAGDRATTVAGQLSELLGQSVGQFLGQMDGAAAEPDLVEALVRPSSEAIEGARALVETVLEEGAEIRVVELWNASGDLVTSANRPEAGGPGPRPSPSSLPGWVESDSAGVSGFSAVDGQIRYAVAAPVRDGERTVGHLLVHLALNTSPDGVRQLEGLIGAAFKVGVPGGLWTDLSGIVEPPPQPRADEPSPPWYETENGRGLVGDRAPVEGTPWVAWVEFPLEEVLERPRAFLGRVLPLGLVVVLMGALAGGVLSRRITAALQESEERFRALASTAPDAIVTADEEGSITYFNPGAERIFGRDEADVMGRSLTMLMPERFHEAHRKGIERRAKGGSDGVVGRSLEFAGLHADGSEFPLELSLAARRTDGRTSFTGIIRDVTARHEQEQELRRYAAELEAANEELEAFSYSVSHDLRAPLRAVHGFSQAVLEDHGERLDERGGDYLRRVCAAAERMGVLIDDLLELSRATRTELQLEPVDLSELARRTAAELEASDPERDVDFRIAPGLAAEGDEELLGLVMSNLMGNAWKFTEGKDRAVIEVAAGELSPGSNGGRAAEPVTPGTSSRRARGASTLERGPDHFYVRDDGAGFDMTYADKLFDPFQRLHSAKEFEGTGIGLALVQRIIHKHGGRVWGEGAVGEGATFHFTLPAR